jgi:hypothetical protein
MLRSAPPAVYESSETPKTLTSRPPPPGRLENSELAANSRKKEYSVSLPLCLAGFWLIKGGVGGGGVWGGGGRGATRGNSARRRRSTRDKIHTNPTPPPNPPANPPQIHCCPHSPPPPQTPPPPGGGGGRLCGVMRESSLLVDCRWCATQHDVPRYKGYLLRR